MKKGIIIIVGLFIFVGAFSLQYCCAEVVVAPFEVKTYKGISYMGSGIGLDERAMLRKIARNYRLKLVFAVKNRELMSDVAVRIMDASGKKVFEAISEGPWFYTNVPPGTYTVMAKAFDKVIEKKVRVHSRGQAELRFFWEKVFDDPTKTRKPLRYEKDDYSGENRLILRTIRNIYSLALAFTVKGGGRTGAVMIEIKNDIGVTVVNAASSGPWFCVNLLPAQYTVLATTKEETIHKKVTVTQQHESTLRFEFSGESAKDAESPFDVQYYEDRPFIQDWMNVDEREALRARGKDYNTKIAFSTEGFRHPGAVALQFVDANNKMVFDAVATGPWFYTYLDAGMYTVHAIMKGKVLRKSINVNEIGLSALTFIWKKFFYDDIDVVAADGTTWTYQMNKFGDIPYMSSGLCPDERNDVPLSANNYSLKLAFASEQGTCKDEVVINIKDAAGKEVFKATATGPWLYTNLPPGEYRVSATMKGETHIKRVRVLPSQQAALSFFWAGKTRSYNQPVPHENPEYIILPERDTSR